ncbi:hypothetical protein Pecwa_1564 [Pectobacterium parmentieri WPP163]|nr:hypothetical protein Pecwa_1564 [Pectobacterium parmentieri WPP163]
MLAIYHDAMIRSGKVIHEAKWVSDSHILEEAGKRERLIYVDMDKVILEMKSAHIKALLFSMS